MPVPLSSRALLFAAKPTPEMADAVRAIGTAKKKSAILGLKPSCERKGLPRVLLKDGGKEFIYSFHILRRVRFISLAVFGAIDLPERIGRVG